MPAAGKVLSAQVIPSVDDAAVVDATLLVVATKVLFPYAVTYQVAVAGKVLCVHVAPSVEETAFTPLVFDTAIKVPFPYEDESLDIILPKYRVWVVFISLAVCFATWYVIERTKLGAYLRAGTENPKLLQAFGINVPLMISLAYAYGVGLAGFAGVLAAPIFQVNPLMGSNLIIVVFAVVVIGGMGSIMGAILTGLGLGLVEGLTKVFYPEASGVVIFVIMAIVLLIRPAGLFGREK